MVNKTVEIYGRLDCAFNNAGIEGAALTPITEYMENAVIRGTPRHPARGMEYVIINGRAVVERGEHVGGDVGVILRGGES